jgi:hypothetical protein
MKSISSLAAYFRKGCGFKSWPTQWPAFDTTYHWHGNCTGLNVLIDDEA